MKEVTTEALEKAHEEYESRRGTEDAISIPALEIELGLPKGKLKNYRANKDRVKSALQAAESSGVSAQLVRDWPLESIMMRGNARTEFAEEELRGLADSIKATDGELQFAVGYEEVIEGKTWCVLIIGERRFRANELRRDRGEDVTVMPVRMVAKPSQKDFMIMNLVENNQRVNLTPSEEAKWLRDMLDLADPVSGLPLFSEVTIGEDIGKRREYVCRALSSLGAPLKAREALDAGKVSVAVVGVIGSLPESMREQASQEMIFGLAGAMSEKEARNHVKNNYRRDLRQADFDKEDEGLTDAGACTVCVWWGGKRDDVGGKAAVHQCLNPVCFQAKQAACAEREKARIMAEGGDVVILSDEESRQIFNGVMGGLSPTCGFVDLDVRPDAYFLVDGKRNRESVPKWRQALKGDLPTVHMAWDLGCKKHELVETRMAMVCALASPFGSLFRADAAKGLLTRDELHRQNRITNAVKKADRAVCLDGARALMKGLGLIGFCSEAVICMIETVAEQGLKADDFLFLCEMMEPEMTRSEMTGRGFCDLLHSTAFGLDDALALLVIVLQVRSLRYKGFEPWCEEGPMAELCKAAEFSPAGWLKTWKQRRTVAERSEVLAIEKEKQATEGVAAGEGGAV